jgi:hypothetical protein
VVTAPTGKVTNNQKANDKLQGVLEVEVVQSNIDKLEHCYVGILREIDGAENTQMAISMEGFQDIQAVPLGMDLILLSSTKHEGVKKAVELNEAWWEKRFLDIKGWDPSQQPRGRRVWVRIFGTPIHAWGWDCFEKIVCTWGRLIRLDEQTKN